MTFHRWTLHDPEGVLTDHTFAANPSRRDDPELDENLEPEPQQVDGGLAVMPAAPSAGNWSFVGITYTLAEVAVFEAWLDNGRPIVLTDHHLQQWSIQIQDFETVRKGSRKYPEKQEITVKCLMMGSV